MLAAVLVGATVFGDHKDPGAGPIVTLIWAGRRAP